MKNEFPHADDMLKLAHQASFAKAQEQISKLSDAIETAAEEGRTFLSVECHLYSQTKEALLRKGFILDHGKESEHIIRWE